MAGAVPRAWSVLPVVPLAVVLAAGVLVLALLATAGVTPPPAADGAGVGLRTLSVRGVVAPDDAERALVILQVDGAAELLPVAVPLVAGEAIERLHAGEVPGLDPLLRAAGVADGAIDEVVLDLDEPAHELAGRLRLRGGAKEIPAAVGDAIVAALAADRPLRATPRAIASNGLTREVLVELLAREPAAQREPPIPL